MGKLTIKCSNDMISLSGDINVKFTYQPKLVNYVGLSEGTICIISKLNDKFTIAFIPGWAKTDTIDLSNLDTRVFTLQDGDNFMWACHALEAPEGVDGSNITIGRGVGMNDFLENIRQAVRIRMFDKPKE